MQRPHISLRPTDVGYEVLERLLNTLSHAQNNPPLTGSLEKGNSEHSDNPKRAVATHPADVGPNPAGLHRQGNGGRFHPYWNRIFSAGPDPQYHLAVTIRFYRR